MAMPAACPRAFHFNGALCRLAKSDMGDFETALASFLLIVIIEDNVFA